MLLAAGASVAQPMSLDTPSDSPLWWTLTPDFSPEQLQAAYFDPVGGVIRYQEAVEAGLEEPLANEDLERVVFYEHPQIHAEITPMWLALNILATSTISIFGEDIVVAELRDFEITEGGVQKIMSVSAKLERDEKQLMAEVGPKQIEIQLIAIEAKRKGHSKESVDRAFAEKDSSFFSRTGSGRRKDELEELLASIDRNPPAEATEGALIALKKNLQEADWEAFRHYLLVAIVSRTGPSMNFDS